MVRSPLPLRGCTCGSRRSFASSAWSGSGLGNERQSLEVCFVSIQSQISCLDSHWSREGYVPAKERSVLVILGNQPT